MSEPLLKVCDLSIRFQSPRGLVHAVNGVSFDLMPAVLSYAVVMLGVAILAEAALGFLGLSVRPPQPSWGGMIAAERGNLADAPQAVFIPAGFLFVSVLAINLLGEALRRIFDIRATTL